MRLVQEDAAEFFRQDHAAAAMFFDEPFGFGKSDVAIRDKLDDAVSVSIANPIALLDRLARCVEEHHGVILPLSHTIPIPARSTRVDVFVAMENQDRIGQASTVVSYPVQ